MKRRARTIALPRKQRPLQSWLPWSILLIALGLAAMGAARAQTAGTQTTTPPPMPPRSEPTGPTVVPPAGTGAMEKGVIRPPAAVDPGMTRSTPNPQAFPTPIIPPPGSQGGNPRVQPK